MEHTPHNDNEMPRREAKDLVSEMSEIEEASNSQHDDPEYKDSLAQEGDEKELKYDFEEELRAAFEEFDEDQSGTISKEEFGNFMRKLGYHPTMVELQEMIDEVDKDRVGIIGFEDFKTIMTKTIRDEFTRNSSIEAFAVFDKSKSGKISKDVLNNILMTKGDQNLNENEIQELLKYAFEGSTGDEINYKDFVKNTFDLFK